VVDHLQEIFVAGNGDLLGWGEALPAALVALLFAKA